VVRRRAFVGIAACGVVALVTATLLAGSPSMAAASGPATSPGPAPIKFLYRTKALRVVGAAPAARRVSAAASGFDPAESALLRYRSAHEHEISGESEPTSALPNPPNLPIGDGEGVQQTFDALNHFQNRYSDSGNQFSGEPPDQALCVSSKYVLENVNAVLQVYTPKGKALLPGQPGIPGAGPVGVSVNQFFGMPTSFDRTNILFGPFVSDPECVYDAAQHRWFVTTLELDLDPDTGDFAGPSSIFVAVSRTGNPLGQWNVWSIDTTNNGKGGTPNHHCSSKFCYGDYPQVGIDSGGLYITTNEFDNLGAGEFHGAQLYAVSKHDLETGVHAPSSQYFQNVQSSTAGDVAYTLEPSNGLPGDWDHHSNGTMYFGQSMSPYSGGDLTHRVALFALGNTGSLATANPDLTLRETAVHTEAYSIPAHALQRPGPTPLLHCVNIGRPCIGVKYPHQDGPIPLDAGPGKISGAWERDGVVYLVAGTALDGPGAADYDGSNGEWAPIDEKAGVAYFGLRPSMRNGQFSATMAQQGYAGVQNANLIYPSITVSPEGKGVITASLSGPNTYPSAAFTTFRAAGGFSSAHHGGDRPTSVQVSGAGVGPYDGDSGTWDGGLRPRWGDYSYSTVSPDGSVWVATEYVNQRCGWKTFVNDPNCGNTRTFYANWGTRIIQVKGSH
jgi:hypothetical protein